MTFMVRTVLAGLLALGGADAAGAQAYPSKPVRILVPFAPGGSVDAMARTIGKSLGAKWGVQPVIENRLGAGGTIATQALAQSAPDGYTLLLTTSAHPINALFYPRLPYDTFRDFTPITQVAATSLAVVVRQDSPFKSFGEVIAEARAKPGALSYGISGNGTATHLSGELINHMAGTKIVAVPYRGGAPALMAVIAGEIQMSINPLAEAVGQIEGGKVRALAVTAPKRSAVLPDVPTVAEQGLAGYENTVWLGFLAPAGLPPSILATINNDLAHALKDPAVLDYLKKAGYEPVGSTPKEFEASMRAEASKWEPVLKAANIRLE